MKNKNAFIKMKRMFGNDMGICKDVLIYIDIDECLFPTLLNSYFSMIENLLLPVFENISDEKRHKMSIILSKSLRLEYGINNNNDFVKYIEYFNDAFDSNIIIEKIC
jgi:hypothetical protein